MPFAALDDSTAVALLVMWIVLGVLLYFIPSFVASGRGHPSSGAIFVLNLFLGWSLLGWVGALVWACTAIDERRRRQAAYEFECPRCLTPIASDRVRACPGCGIRLRPY